MLLANYGMWGLLFILIKMLYLFQVDKWLNRADKR